MTEENPQIDPQNPGPTISLLAVINTLTGIGLSIEHVLSAHEVDDKATGDLAFLMLKIANYIDEAISLAGLEDLLAAEDAKIAETAAGEVPEDVWAAFAETVGEEAMKEIVDSLGGDNPQ